MFQHSLEFQIVGNFNILLRKENLNLSLGQTFPMMFEIQLAQRLWLVTELSGFFEVFFSVFSDH